MRKNVMNLELAKKKVESLLGKPVTVRYNKGRNKIVYFDGQISEYHNNVFIITVYNEFFDRISCCYTDLLCGDIAFKLKNDINN